MWYKNLTVYFLFSILLTAALPEANAQTLRILPLGNSITAGNMCVNGSISGCTPIGGHIAVGYRLRLFNLLTAAGYNVDFVGTETFGNALMADSDCGGFGGISDGRLADVMETGTSTHTGWVTSGPYMNSNPADVVLLHIGTNDILAADTSWNDVGRILDAIDDYEATQGTPVMVFLARIISTRGNSCNNDPRVKAYNRMMENLAASRKASGDQLILVDMECAAGLDYNNDMMDEVHPNQDGYDKMGQAWYQAIRSWMDPPGNSYTLSMETPTGMGSVSPSVGLHIYAEGTSVSVSANPAPGYQFSNWTGDLLGTENPASLTMNGNKSIRATFSKLRYELTLNTDGSPGAAISPWGSIFVDHGAATTIEVTNIPEGYGFKEWELVGGSSVSIGNPSAPSTTVILGSGDATIRANFEQKIQVLGVNIPNEAHIIGDTVRADILVRDDQGSFYELESGRIGGYELEQLQRIDSGSYVARFIVFEGGSSFLAEEDIPVSNLVLTDGLARNPAVSDFIRQDQDLIDALAPEVFSMTVPSAVFSVGDTIEMTVMADGESYQAVMGSSINGVGLGSGRLEFSEMGGGEYRLSYVLAWEDPQVAAGELEASILLRDVPGNLGAAFTRIEENTLSVRFGTGPGAEYHGKAPAFYPNPAADYLDFDLGDQKWSGSRIEIADLSGRIRISMEVSPGLKTSRIDISHLEAGAYLIRLERGEAMIWMDKLIKPY